ncbi:hypothetical protein AAZV13_10G156000 [Glycine max]
MNVTSLDWDHGSLTNSLQTTPFERSETDVVEAPTTEDEDEIKSVYVRNLSPTVSVSEIEEEFKNFGRIRLDSVSIRSCKVYILNFEIAVMGLTVLRCSLGLTIVLLITILVH